MSYAPYMFGGSRGGYSSSTMSFNQAGQRVGRGAQESVRDCMSWPSSLGSPSQAQGDQGMTWSNNNSGQSSYVSSNSNGGSTFNFSQPRMAQQTSMPSNYPQAKAFMQGGQGELHPLSIPCQLAPSGSPMQPMSGMAPMTIKVTAPPGTGRNGQPMTFQINPYAGLQAQVQRRY